MIGLPGVRGALIDVDGTLLTGDRAIPGAAAALAALRASGVGVRLVTNTTRRPRARIAAVLGAAGIEVDVAQLLVPATLAARRIRASGRPRAALLVPPETFADFAGVQPVDERPEWVVVGDLGAGFSWEVVNRAFGWLRAGARLLALHKNPYWHAGERGLVVDAGAYVAALEYAAGVTAEVVGKPARGFFEEALSDLGLPAADVVVIGDDPENDGAGGRRAGCRTVLVRTGKFSPAALERAGLVPDRLIDSIADLLSG